MSGKENGDPKIKLRKQVLILYLNPQQPLNGQRVLRISRSQQNEVRKDLLMLVTVNVGALSGRNREVVDMFERKRVTYQMSTRS